ncbi:MAG: hypothetical protein FJ254_10215 [Phycisphaerae bacterium]|nr:hypothetical protein [Phycisphaerae bacterium]
MTTMTSMTTQHPSPCPSFSVSPRLMLITTLLSSTIVGAAAAQHAGDIGLTLDAGEITTRAITSSGVADQQRVFTGAFADTGVPWFTANPGYDAPTGEFPVGTRLGVRFMGPIRVWDGDSFELTSPSGALAGERLRLSFLTANATSGDGPVPGFDLAVQSDGGWHRHLSMTLLAAPGASVPEVGTYLAPLQIYSTATGITASKEFWLVLNGGSDAASFAAAVNAALDAMSPACTGDIDASGAVDGADLGILLSSWGSNGNADLDSSGSVDGADLGILLSAWGTCP